MCRLRVSVVLLGGSLCDAELLSCLFEAMWSDIDLYHAYRDFTTDPVRYPIEEVKEFIRELVCSRVSSNGLQSTDSCWAQASNHQHCTYY